jgi:hypothetical protein
VKAKQANLRRIAEIASALTALVIVLVALGYWFCVWFFFTMPRFVTPPVDSVEFTSRADLFQSAVGNLAYWVAAFTVTLGLALLITVLGVRAMSTLWQCAPDALIVDRVDESDPATTVARLDLNRPRQTVAGVAPGVAPGSASGEKR